MTNLPQDSHAEVALRRAWWRRPGLWIAASIVALTWIVNARAQAPFDAEFLTSLGELRLEEDDTLAARRLFERAVELAPDDHLALIGLARTFEQAAAHFVIDNQRSSFPHACSTRPCRRKSANVMRNRQPPSFDSSCSVAWFSSHSSRAM